MYVDDIVVTIENPKINQPAHLKTVITLTGFRVSPLQKTPLIHFTPSFHHPVVIFLPFVVYSVKKSKSLSTQ